MNKSLPRENIYAHTKKVRVILDWVERRLAVSGAPLRLLDFGCGNGEGVAQFLMRPGVEYCGVDIHQASLDHARRRFGGPHAIFSQEVPDDVAFDMIVYSDVLEHLPDTVGLLRKHHSLLRDDGILFASLPNGYGPFELERCIDRWCGLYRTASFLKHRLFRRPVPSVGTFPYNHESPHVQFFTRKSLTSALRQAGFAIAWWGHGGFVGAEFSSWLLRGERIARWNAQIADILPSWAVSTWYVVARKTQTAQNRYPSSGGPSTAHYQHTQSQCAVLEEC